MKSIAVAVLIDGGHLRVLARQAGLKYDPALIEKIAHACIDRQIDEVLFRAFYYDCPPYSGKAKLPVSGVQHEFKGNDSWLRDLASRDFFAVRLGVLKFRGYKPKTIPVAHRELTDDDFAPDFEQKGVDMRIGLDIAQFCQTQSVRRIALVTNDTDCIPAMKYGRKAGLQVILVDLPGNRTAPELSHHADIRRMVQWPKQTSEN